MVRSVAGDLPEQVKNNQSVNMAAGNGGQEISQYSWFTVYECKRMAFGITNTRDDRGCGILLKKLRGNTVTKGGIIL